MTNGEKIQSVFSNINFGTLAQNDVIVNKDYSNNDEPQVFIPVKVWNAEYKEPTESRELEKNSKLEKGTTKNDLGVDCISRAQAQTEIEMNASRYTIAKERGGMGHVEWSDQLIKVSDAVDIIRHLPSVKPQEPRWIPVSERLPKELCGVLVYCPTDDNIYCAYLEKGVWKIFSPEALEEIKEIVTAWMPLPKAYREVEK